MTFATPSILWALFALLIPIIVHLFDFRRHKKIYFSDNYFLNKISEKSQKQRRLRSIIIMCLRMFFIASIVFAFAKPTINKGNQAKSVSDKLCVNIYIDNSLSMEIIDGKTDKLSLARNQAKSIIKAYQPNTLFRLITNDFSGEMERYVLADEGDKIINNIDFCPYSRTMSNVFYRMVDLSERNEPLAKHLFYFISDFQKNTADIKNIINTNSLLFLYPIVSPELPNVSVDSLWFSSPLQLENSIIKLSARIKNYSNFTIEKVPIRLYVDGSQKGLSDIDISAGGSEVVDFSFIVNSGGSHQGYVEIDDSPINFDDRMFFAFDIAKSLPIYHIYGANATKTIAEIFGKDSLFQFKSISDGNIDFSQIFNSKLIVLDELTQVPSGLASELMRSVNDGASVLIIPNAKDIKSYKDGFSVLKIPFFSGIDTNDTKVGSMELSHPLFSGVFTTTPKQILLPSVFSHYTILKSDEQSIINMLNGKSFLCDYKRGKGHIFLLSVPLQKSFSNFSSNALIVPVVMQMAFSSSKSTAIAYPLDYCDAIELPLFITKTESPPILQSFDNLVSFIPGYSGGSSQVIFLNSQAKNAGAYKVLQNGEVVFSFGLNYPRAESNPDCYKIDEIKNIISSNKNISILKNSSNYTNNLAIVQKDFKMWKIFIIFALIFLAVELILLRIWI